MVPRFGDRRFRTLPPIRCQLTATEAHASFRGQPILHSSPWSRPTELLSPCPLRSQRTHNQTVQRTGASRFAQRQIERHRRLAPVADLCVRPLDHHAPALRHHRSRGSSRRCGLRPDCTRPCEATSGTARLRKLHGLGLFRGPNVGE